MFLTKDKKIYWQTKDKELIRLKDISDSHLENIRKMLIRYICKVEDMWDAFESYEDANDTGLGMYPPSTYEQKEWIKIITREQAYRKR